jgi:DhnA family fructose-bisphosphate aldolase class Ia
VLDNATLPVVVLGGERDSDERALLMGIHAAMRAGASGAAIGRNIWGHASPARMTAAIAAIVHGGASVEQAVQTLR